MHISDRALALVLFVLGIVAPLALLGVLEIVSPVRLFLSPFIGFILTVPSLALWSIAAICWFRNNPVAAANDDLVRRRIRAWYRDAKKWIDEHPENVEMKDL